MLLYPLYPLMNPISKKKIEEKQLPENSFRIQPILHISTTESVTLSLTFKQLLVYDHQATF